MALGQITWEMVQRQAPDDGRRREAIGGDLWVSAAPSVRHQRVSRRLELELHRLLQEPGHGEVFHAPVGVEFSETGEGVQPDILFVSAGRRGIVARDWIRGAPDLVVEIVSPATAERDRGLKLDLYRRQGVREYWIVDPEEDAVDVWRFGSGAAGGAAGDSGASGMAGQAPGPGAGAPAGRTRAGGGAGAATHERFSDALPVRIGGEVVGEIGLEEVFAKGD